MSRLLEEARARAAAELEARRVENERRIRMGETNGKGSRKAYPKREFRPQYKPIVFKAADFAKLAETEPAEFAEMATAARRPNGVSTVAHGIATRKAAGEPMLTANPRMIVDAMERGRKTAKMPKGRLYANLVVKPLTVRNAKLGAAGAGFWGERVWRVYNLKYSSGVVAVTDRGAETAMFSTIGELKSAIRKSGWEIVR